MMRDLAISYGNSRQAKNWVNKTISFDALKERLKTTIRTTESAEEYAKMSKAERDASKDHGGFVGGTLKGGRRKIDTVELRSMIALDGDRIDKAFLDNYETIAPYTSVLYTTHSSTEDSPRVRIIFPMTRDVSSEEFVAVSRYVAQALGIDFFDECSYQPNQLMYWPSTPQNGVFVYKETDKESCRRTRNGRIPHGFRPPPARARRTRSHSRRCRIRCRRTAWSVCSTGSSSL